MVVAVVAAGRGATLDEPFPTGPRRTDRGFPRSPGRSRPLPRIRWPDASSGANPDAVVRGADARANEQEWLSPLAVRSYETRGRLRPEAGVGRPHAVPARPRPDRPFQAVSTPEGEDAGLHRPGRRPLPHPDDPHARDDRHRPGRRSGAAAERGSRRGDRARARHRAHAVRARRRGGARRGARASASAAISATTSSRCGSPSG